MKFCVPSSPSNSITSGSLSFYSIIEDPLDMSPTDIPEAASQGMMGLQRAQSRWPSWNGSPTSFDFFMLRLKIRAQDEVKAMASGEMICFNMVKAIPDVKK